MKRNIITTADGSKTIQIEEWQEQYHSTHGAIQESQHVFIDNGLIYYVRSKNMSSVTILEYGFGTGLNALMTRLTAQELKINIDYTGLEAFPVQENELEELNYPEQLNIDPADFDKLHETQWDQPLSISPDFMLHKQNVYFEHFKSDKRFDIIYYDAFGARVQPELWTKEIFEKIYEHLKEEGIMVTYSSKGSVRRALESIGFKVERLKGPPGKRHMLRASK
ncbi:MAG: tRNA (5-methylaminomethyl-2-thiouridine)(34)-methyltransferase MnmD [Flavobacteriaceae bacterium]|nr:tRNA (5-methylaminomethyl-2-thiouridine)(34)-methyltransferase MnmD [Bacteroidia bacterium]MBT8286444.1 tRNA (5-methylaminomethyl-2-thiouridine)(34)-methyltransferase MnmD [Bacteroidia bacterium]NNF75720.1 tRNA (5-methylaminomethyl-2-thiouridine)(34)-methyltransferase MnmD [Flavobacteriaceae bacterium]NNK74267.1 tRNA (5-methylaminomethyl-2-thiouridine)(34)-methyltransferase MnmD [Flavobacteriaceae bacterium]